MPADAVLRGQCVPLGRQGLPYAPVAGLLAALVRRVGGEQVLDWAGAGGHALGTVLPDLVRPEPGAELQLQLFESVARVLAGASQAQPQVVVIEDVHWSDESTRALLRFLAHALAAARVLLLLTVRSEELTGRHPVLPFLAELARLPSVDRLEVGPLERSETAELARRVQGREATAAELDQLYRRSGGIPFYVEELLAAGAPGKELPADLRAALQVRFLELSEPAQATARIAAVLGHRVEHDVLTALVGRPETELETSLREIVGAGVLRVDGGGYAFRHALLREAVESDLLPSERLRLHARAASTLAGHADGIDQAGSAHAIALHWLAARDWPQAFAALVRATRTAATAHAENLQMFEHLLELWDLVPDPEAVAGERAAVLTAAAHTAKDAGEYQRALDLVTMALAAPDPEVDRRFDRLVFRLHLRIDLIQPGADADADLATTLLDRVGDAHVRARGLEQLAAYQLNAGLGYVEVGLDQTSLGHRAVAAAAALDDPALEANARITLGTMLLAAGAESAGLAELERALVPAAGEPRVDLRLRLNYSDGLHTVGRYAEAVEQAEIGSRLARSIGLERALGCFVAGNAAESLLALGRWDEAAALIDRELRRDPPTMARTHLQLLRAWLRAWRGEHEAARADLAEHLELLGEDQPFPQSSVQAIRVDAEHALLVGDAHRAWRDAELLLRWRDSYGPGRTLPALVPAAAAARRLDRQEPAGRVETIADVVAATGSAASARLWRPVVRAELADDAEQWRVAVDHLEAVEGPVHLRPYAQWRLARHLAADRDRSAARDVIDSALRRADALGSAPMVDRLGALAAQVGVGVSMSAGAGPLAGLTGRELEVLRLVATGASNAEIGSALFISPKTASVHVSNILAKLGARTRTEAASVALRSGLSA